MNFESKNAADFLRKYFREAERPYWISVLFSFKSAAALYSK